MKKWMRLLIWTLLPAIFLTSCGDDDDVSIRDAAKVMMVHASPDAAGIDVLIDNASITTGPLTFPSHTGYLDVRPGNRNIKINEAGSATTLIESNTTFQANQEYSVFIIDQVDDIEALILTDDLTPPAAGRSHVRFVHLAPDGPIVDIAVVDGPVLFTNRSFKDATSFTPVDAGAYNLVVRASGTGAVLLSVPNIQLTNGRIYTIFAQGYVSPPQGNSNFVGVGIIENF